MALVTNVIGGTSIYLCITNNNNSQIYLCINIIIIMVIRDLYSSQQTLNPRMCMVQPVV